MRHQNMSLTFRRSSRNAGGNNERDFVSRLKGNVLFNHFRSYQSLKRGIISFALKIRRSSTAVPSTHFMLNLNRNQFVLMRAEPRAKLMEVTLFLLKVTRSGTF